jgi:hypothetical protein
MSSLLRKAVEPIHGGNLHNNDRSDLYNIAQLRKMKEKAVGRGARMCWPITGLREMRIRSGNLRR